MITTESAGPGWEAMRDVLSRVAVGPKGSRDLTRAEAAEALRLCLDREASDIQIGVFLIAERLKRETDAENAGFLEALIAASDVVRVATPDVVSLADPYDGFRRTPHFAPVVASVLAACGLPTFVHGAETMPPKDGLTARQVLRSLGRLADDPPGRDGVEAAARRLANRGVAYVRVEDFCPALHALGAIRREIAKRPFLATLEKLITPLRGSETTHVVAGWVHPGYETLVAGLMRDAGMTSTLMVKGREGHVDPRVDGPTRWHGYGPGGEAASGEVDPKGLGLLWSEDPGWPALDPASVGDLWTRALTKKRTPQGLGIRLLAGMVLHHVGRASTVMRGVGMAHEAIVGGAAREIFDGPF